MEDKDRKKFASIMTGLQTIFRADKSLSVEFIETYWIVFEKWDIKRFSRACSNLLQTKKISTFPLPGEIIEAGKDSFESLNAWNESRSLVRKYGHSQSILLDNYPTFRAIEAMGGWIVFCNFLTTEMPFKQREFERLYQMFSEKETGKIELLQGQNDLIPENIINLQNNAQKELINETGSFERVYKNS